MRGTWKVEDGRLTYYDADGTLVGFLYPIDLAAAWPWIGARATDEAVEALLDAVADAMTLSNIRHRLMERDDP